eukprot:scaffold178499_cov30-Tisochrysis_lutea.AAC.5
MEGLRVGAHEPEIVLEGRDGLKLQIPVGPRVDLRAHGLEVHRLVDYGVVVHREGIFDRDRLGKELLPIFLLQGVEYLQQQGIRALAAAVGARVRFLGILQLKEPEAAAIALDHVDFAVLVYDETDGAILAFLE